MEYRLKGYHLKGWANRFPNRPLFRAGRTGYWYYINIKGSGIALRVPHR